MANKKNFWYVLVLENDGPAFVTKVEYSNKTAYWNKLEKPLEMSMESAKDLTLGLNLNFHVAFTVCMPFALEEQPCSYNLGHFEWVYNKEEEANE